MSLECDKKTRHAKEAEAAIDAGNHRQAAFNLAKAAEYALKLSGKSDGRIRRKYIGEARDLVELAEGFHAKAAAPPVKVPRAAREGPGGKENGAEDWLVSEKPELRLADIAGMDDVKRKLAEMVIEPIRHADKARQWGIRAGGGILLFGPPGNGKTTLGKAVAGELEAEFYYASGAEIRSKWHGESEQRLRRLIQQARSRPVSVLFLDDVDGLLPKRGGNSVVDNRIVTQFLNEIGGFVDSPNILLLLGATNNPWDLDEAVFRTGRFDEKIYVGLPDAPAREFLLRKHLGATPADGSIVPAALAVRLDGFTGSDLVAVMESAKRIGFRRSLEGGSPVLTMEDVDTALRSIPSSVTPEMMRRYEAFGKARFK